MTALGPYNIVPALREALSTVDRRIFLSVTGAALTALAAGWAAGDTHAQSETASGPPVGDELVAMLEESSAGLTSLPTEQRQYIPDLLDAHLTTVTNLLENGRYPKRVGLRLHTLASSLSQTVAWHRFDVADHPTAAKFWIAGLRSAHASGDRDMGAALLGDLAYQAAWRKDHVTAAGLLEHALTRSEHPAARSLLNLRLARTLAAQGERRAALRSLDAAERLLDTASGSERPAWLSEADLAVDSGQALLDLGDTARAHRLIGEGQALLPPARDKTRGVFLAYRAASHLNLREPELAAATARESLQLARRIGAPRCVQLVHDLIPRFRSYRNAEGVPELLHLAAS
ncbi:XRE family transcriptional regulator [Streptomyces sp. MI02-7b]|uniref:XRE family transcriptional regulator n=1 Tax=Streptomyces sp. MI02-7b TaxID=462941 RepID=UPI0029B1DDDF|nr:XRE family transcriptional regulator [Streptomyces sp. MI02-7b]MDX3074020.1 XRE family transcriptional regulator [Streptomyces sp. MI02-7b]